MMGYKNVTMSQSSYRDPSSEKPIQDLLEEVYANDKDYLREFYQDSDSQPVISLQNGQPGLIPFSGQWKFSGCIRDLSPGINDV
jgi:hypothetical protein